MTNPDIATQLDRFCRELTAAAEEANAERLAQVLEAQREFVTSHVTDLDDACKTRIRTVIELSLLVVKSSRAHCLDAVQVNQRKLGVLAAYQAG